MNETRGQGRQNDGNLRSFGLLGDLDHPSTVDSASFWSEDLDERSLGQSSAPGRANEQKHPDKADVSNNLGSSNERKWP